MSPHTSTFLSALLSVRLCVARSRLPRCEVSYLSSVDCKCTIELTFSAMYNNNNINYTIHAHPSAFFFITSNVSEEKHRKAGNRSRYPRDAPCLRVLNLLYPAA